MLCLLVAIRHIEVYHKCTCERTNCAQRDPRAKFLSYVMWSSGQFRALWYRSSFGRGAPVSQSFPGRGYYGTTRMRNKPLFACTHWPQLLSFACNSIRWRCIVNSLGSQSSYSKAGVTWSQQQLYAMQPLGSWGQQSVLITVPYWTLWGCSLPLDTILLRPLLVPAEACVTPVEQAQ